MLLKKLVERHQIPVFNDLDDAIHCIAKILKDDGGSPLENNLRNVFDSLHDESGDMNYSQVYFEQMRNFTSFKSENL
jgi:hypothetical protein